MRSCLCCGALSFPRMPVSSCKKEVVKRSYSRTMAMLDSHTQQLDSMGNLSPAFMFRLMGHKKGHPSLTLPMLPESHLILFKLFI